MASPAKTTESKRLNRDNKLKKNRSSATRVKLAKLAAKGRLVK